MGRGGAAGATWAVCRYLTHAEPDYYDKLSNGSKTTLKFQGGPMSNDEADVFRASDSFDACRAMRRWDEGSKQPAWEQTLRSWSEYVPLIERAMGSATDAWQPPVAPAPIFEAPRATEIVAAYFSPRGYTADMVVAPPRLRRGYSVETGSQ